MSRALWSVVLMGIACIGAGQAGARQKPAFKPQDIPDAAVIGQLEKAGIGSWDGNAFVVTRKRQVRVEGRPRFVRQYMECPGHHLVEEHSAKWRAERRVREKKENYAGDWRVTDYDVWCESKQEGPEYVVHSVIRHKDDASNCCGAIAKERVLDEGSLVQVDSWFPSDSDIAHLKGSQHWELRESRKLNGPETHQIRGIDVTRDFWTEQLVFVPKLD